MATYMVFDVESIGLHGEGFAVGYVVIDERGNHLAEARYATHPRMASGKNHNRKWVSENVPEMPETHESPDRVRQAFWGDWIQWKRKGAILCADVPWPVESRFLLDCIFDDWQQGPSGQANNETELEMSGPYPLIDIASVRMAKGYNPLATEPRHPIETPIHDPLCDARQSARLLIQAMSADATNPQPLNAKGE